MSDPALENSDPSGEQVPWDSIGSSDGAFEESENPLTPVAERSAVPDSGESEDEESGATLRSAPAWTRSESNATSGGGWTLSALCAGLALIACCVLIPQADANRRLAYEREGLKRDLTNIEQQIAVNKEFLKKVADDPILAQRLAQRQMKVIPQGTEVLDLAHDVGGMSPFQLVNVDPAPALPAYKPLGGTVANLCYGAHTRLYLIGASLLMIAAGLVLR